MKLAILDDYQNAALSSADWSAVAAKCTIQTFSKNLAFPGEAASSLAPFEIICCMRERMAFPRALLESLPKLQLICITGAAMRSLDIDCATERGITVCHTTMPKGGLQVTAELTWGLLLALVRNIALEDRRMRAGAWQTTIGTTLHGKTLGLLGLGRVGRCVAEYGRAFGMRVVAWSQNLTPEAAAAAGVEWVSKEELLRTSDAISVHLVLSARTRGLIGAEDLALMKPTAVLVNTARGPIVDEAALIAALTSHRIAGAAIDVFDQEPLRLDSELLKLDNVLVTPHLGYVTKELYRVFYGDTAQNVAAWLDGAPVRVLNPSVKAG